MSKKDIAVNYWKMSYKGKFKRTLYIIPVVAFCAF